jgi:ATP phosphoribosyltransferase
MEEGGFTGEAELDTGLFASSIALLGRAGGGGLAWPPVRPIVSQIPRRAARLLREAGLEGASVAAVAGTAESWIALGLADLCVDTVQTGATAAANGLTPLRVIGETSLGLYLADGVDAVRDPAPRIIERLLA